MIKLINLLICFVLINDYGHSTKLTDERGFQQFSIDHPSSKYDFKESFRNRFGDFRTRSIDLESSASSNELDMAAPTYFDEKIEITKKQDQRFSNWFDIGERSNQTSEQSSKLELNLANLNGSLSRPSTKSTKSSKSTKKKWRLVSSSTLSDTGADDNEFNLTNIKPIKKQRRKAKKLKTANLELKLKESHKDDYVKNRIANTTVYTLNKKDNDDLKFKLNDAIDYKNYESNRFRSNIVPNRSNLQYGNVTLSRRTQLSGESSKISKKIMLATMLPSMIKGLTSAHTHVAVLPTIAQPIAPQPITIMQPMPVAVPQIHIVAPPPPPPRPIYHQIIARPAQIVTQPIIQQPIIQQPIIQQQPIVHRKIITQPIIINRPVHVVRQPQIYQQLPVSADQSWGSQEDSNDLNEETLIGDPVDDDDNTSVQQDDGDAYSQNSWGNGQQDQQVRIVPQPIVAQQPDSWGNQQNVQNQKVYHYHTASVPRTTRTIYTQTKMIPSITSVHSTTSYTPEHKHTVVETDHNVKPVMNLVSTSQRKVVSRPVYTVKAIHQPVMQTVQQQQPTYANNQGSWSK